jgi:hypothetical protein
VVPVAFYFFFYFFKFYFVFCFSNHGHVECYNRSPPSNLPFFSYYYIQMQKMTFLFEKSRVSKKVC